jgi:hypothetical protein
VIFRIGYRRVAGARRAAARLVFALTALSWFVPAIAWAGNPDTVYFGGVAFTGNAADTSREFPHLSRIFDAAGNSRVNADIRQRLQAQPAAIKLVFDQLGSIKDADRSTALALAIDRETTSVEHIGNVYKIRLEIAAQLLFFDFKEKQVLGGFPLVLTFIDVRDTPATDEDIQAGFRGMALGTSGQHSLAGEFVATLEHASVPSAASRHLRVGSVTFGPKADEYLQQSAPTVDRAMLRAQVAQEFGKYLAANQHLSILPHGSNQALGSSMAARFVEGEAFQLKIPDADYDISLDVAGFKKIEQSRGNVSVLYIYGAFVDLAVREPLSGKVYFSQRIKQGATKEVPMTQTTVDDWSASYESLLLLFNNFTQALSNPGSPWAGSALPASRDAKAQLSSLAELVKSCR